MKKIAILFLLSGFAISGFSKEKRDILQKEAKEIGIENVLIKDFSDLKLPTYNSRDFWSVLPEVMKKQYVEEAEGALD